MKIIWVLVNCNTIKEAEKIGDRVLRERLIACFEIVPRLTARYFWPPKTGHIETTKGCILILETLPKYFPQIQKMIKKLHSDKLPFIGSLTIGNVDKKYLSWMKGEPNTLSP